MKRLFVVLVTAAVALVGLLPNRPLMAQKKDVYDLGKFSTPEGTVKVYVFGNKVRAIYYPSAQDCVLGGQKKVYFEGTASGGNPFDSVEPFPFKFTGDMYNCTPHGNGKGRELLDACPNLDSVWKGPVKGEIHKTVIRLEAQWDHYKKEGGKWKCQPDKVGWNKHTIRKKAIEEAYRNAAKSKAKEKRKTWYDFVKSWRNNHIWD